LLFAHGAFVLSVPCDALDAAVRVRLCFAVWLLRVGFGFASFSCLSSSHPIPWRDDERVRVGETAACFASKEKGPVSQADHIPRRLEGCVPSSSVIPSFLASIDDPTLTLTSDTVTTADYQPLAESHAVNLIKQTTSFLIWI
jgi:hypothetical protein